MPKKSLAALLLVLMLSLVTLAGDTPNPGIEEPTPTPTPEELRAQTPPPDDDPAALFVYSVISALASVL